MASAGFALGDPNGLVAASSSPQTIPVVLSTHLGGLFAVRRPTVMLASLTLGHLRMWIMGVGGSGRVVSSYKFCPAIDRPGRIRTRIKQLLICEKQCGQVAF